MKFPKIINCAILALIACIPLTSCSKTEIQEPIATHQSMPDDYSTHAIDTFNELASFLPENTSAAAFASYGSIVDTIHTLKSWNLVDENKFNSTISDLATFYKLDPTSLKSFYKAGFHTAKGFALGVVDGNLVLAFSIIDQNDFIQWFDNFTSEEFGRPHTQSSDDNGWKIREITVMNEDFATIALSGDIALVAFGKKFGPNPSKPVSQQLVSAHASKRNLHTRSDAQNLIRQIDQAPFGAMMLSDSWQPASLNAQVRSTVTTAVNTAAVVLSTDNNHLSFALKANVKQNNNYITMIQQIGSGTISPWTSPLIHASQGTAARLLFDPVGLEKAFLQYAPASQKTQWQSVKSKLNQPFMNINFYEQVFKNLAGSAWILPANLNTLTPETLRFPQILSTDVAVLLPIKDVKRAGEFFGKISILKSLVPSNYAQIETIDGILHATVKLQGNTLHVAYADGLIAASSASAWKRTLALYTSPNKTNINNILSSDAQFALEMKGPDAISLITAICPTKCKFAADIAQYFDNIQTSASLKNDLASLTFDAFPSSH